MGLFSRAIRPPDDITPNPNDPASVPPSTVGPDQLVTLGDPHGVTVIGETPPYQPPPRIVPSAWSGWPAEWNTPAWGVPSRLVDTAWMCLDANTAILSTMPPYLVNASPNLNTEWLRNPDPELYFAWEEFARQLFWDYLLGEAFVLSTARYATGWPARFHVVPPWLVNAELRDGLRTYTIGDVNVTSDLLHIRYKSTIGDARGHGPLEVGSANLVAAEVLARYATGLATQGGIPSSIISHPEGLNDALAAKLRDQWIQSRIDFPGMPAVLSGGITWQATQMSPTDMALVDLRSYTDARICALLHVPPEIVSVPGNKDSLTYATTQQLRDQHWRKDLSPIAQTVMSALSGWLLPRGTVLELNRDAYVQPSPYERAQTAQILNAIRDEQGNPVMTVQQIQEAERLTNSTPVELESGVLR